MKKEKRSSEVSYCQLCGRLTPKKYQIELAEQTLKICFTCYDSITPLLREAIVTKMEVEKFYYNLILRLLKNERGGIE